MPWSPLHSRSGMAVASHFYLSPRHSATSGKAPRSSSMRLTYILAATVAAASAALVLAQNPQPTQNQVAVPPRALYSMADVARSLEVSDRQRERLDRLTQQTVSDYQARYNRLADVP